MQSVGGCFRRGRWNRNHLAVGLQSKAAPRPCIGFWHALRVVERALQARRSAPTSMRSGVCFPVLVGGTGRALRDAMLSGAAEGTCKEGRGQRDAPRRAAPPRRHLSRSSALPRWPGDHSLLSLFGSHWCLASIKSLKLCLHTLQKACMPVCPLLSPRVSTPPQAGNARRAACRRCRPRAAESPPPASPRLLAARRGGPGR